MRNLIKFDDFCVLNESVQELEHVALYEAFNNTMDALEDAITNKTVCTIYYKGERKGIVDDGYRYIEPYALGVNIRGNIVVRAWLLKGTSRTGKIDPSLVPGWRLFRVDRISIITPTHQTFTTPRKGYSAEDSGMTEINFTATFP
jgi:predicted DNA-binding transcriptional regulator YafY